MGYQASGLRECHSGTGQIVRYVKVLHPESFKLRRPGMFPLPGAPRQQPMDPSRLQAFMNQPSGSAGNAALKPSNARQSKRLFVSNIPSSASEETVINFFNLQLNGLNVVLSSDPCISAQMSKDRSFALLEFKNPNEATVALAFDGIAMDDNDNMMTSNGTANGSAQGLQVRRPKDYIVPSAAEDEEYQEGVVSPVVPDTPNKVSITNLLPNLSDEQVIELLVAFGALKAFVLVKDASTEESRVRSVVSITFRYANPLPGHCFLRVCGSGGYRYCSRRTEWYGAGR